MQKLRILILGLLITQFLTLAMVTMSCTSTPTTPPINPLIKTHTGLQNKAWLVATVKGGRLVPTPPKPTLKQQLFVETTTPMPKIQASDEYREGLAEVMALSTTALTESKWLDEVWKIELYTKLRHLIRIAPKSLRDKTERLFFDIRLGLELMDHDPIEEGIANGNLILEQTD